MKSIAPSRIVQAVTLLVALFPIGPLQSAPAPPLQPELTPFTLGEVKLAGEIGRRVELTLRGNFLKLNLEDDFLKPFRNPRPKEQVTGFASFIGAGKLGLAAVHFAAESRDPAVV